MPRSLPYLVLTAAIAIPIGVLLWGVLDVAVAGFVNSVPWQNPIYPEGGQGQERVLMMWDYGLFFLISSLSISFLWASRRGGN